MPRGPSWSRNARSRLSLSKLVPSPDSQATSRSICGVSPGPGCLIVIIPAGTDGAQAAAARMTAIAASSDLIVGKDSGLDVEDLRRGVAEDVGLLGVAQRGTGEDVVDRVHFPRIGIVAAEHDLAGA